MTSDVVLDVTDTCEVAFLTGVQRLVRGLARGAGSRVVLIRFDSRVEDFRVIDSIPILEKRNDRGPTRWSRQLLRTLFELLAFQFRLQEATDYLLPRIYYRLAWNFYVKHLGETRLRDNPRWRKGPIWKPQPSSHFVLTEIPREPRHIERIRFLQENDTIRTTVYLHDLIPIISPDLLPAGSRPAIRGEFLSYMDVVRGADEVISNSQSTLNDYRKYESLVPAKHCQETRVIYPPLEAVQPGWFHSNDKGRKQDVVSPSKDREIPVTQILFIGSMGKRKNLEVVLRATFNLVAEGADVQLFVVAGQGRERSHEVDQLLRHATPKQRAAVTLLENLSDEELQNLYESSTLVVVPSLAEGFGLPIIEALQLGKPVISSSIPVFEELSQSLGFRTVDAHDVLGWQEAISETPFQSKKHRSENLDSFPKDWVDFASRLLSEQEKI